MRNKFDKQMLELNDNLVYMGALCENAISLSIRFILKGEKDNLEECTQIEYEINNKEKEIEHQCLKLLLEQQPVARDLRIISAALKMVTDLERIGDQSTDIAEVSRYVKGITPPINLKKMAEEAVKMVSQAIDSFVRKDLELAQKVILQDDVVDALFLEAKSDIISKIKNNQAEPEDSMDMLMIAKYLERIGDHATNIAEWVVFSITGKHKEEVV